MEDSTVRPFHGRAVFCFEPDSKPGSCFEPRKGASMEAWKDFARKNRKAWPMLPLFDKDLDVTLKRNAKLPEKTCRGPSIASFSRVGFNPELTEAILQVSWVTGKGPMPGCGFAQGSQLVLHKTATGWKVAENIISWIT